MYNHAGTPFGGSSISWQIVQISENSVSIRPSAFMCRFPVVLIVGLFGGVIINWFTGVTESPKLYEIVLMFGIPTLAMFVLWYLQGRSLVVDAFGVEWRFLFRKHRLRWREIHDFGLSYAYWGQVRLYFSEERLETNGKGKKRMEGRHAVILIHIQNRNKTGKILNVCRQYTRIRPFLCSEEGKLAGVLKDR